MNYQDTSFLFIYLCFDFLHHSYSTGAAFDHYVFHSKVQHISSV